MPVLLGAPVRGESLQVTTVQPSYRDLLKFIEPGEDEFPGEKLAAERGQILHRAFKTKRLPISQSATGNGPLAESYRQLAADLSVANFASDNAGQKSSLADHWQRWIESLGDVHRVGFFLLPDDQVRFEVSSRAAQGYQYRTGLWRIEWNGPLIVSFSALTEEIAARKELMFQDVSAHALGTCRSYREQLRYGVPYWRARMDPATGIDLYGSNGISVGDIDGDGVDEVYICQPGGLPNRLFKIGEDGQFRDVTEVWNVGLLDNTSCALFLDLRNSGKQDLVVLRDSGPVLFLNEGRSFRLRTDAFLFEDLPRGGFTGMAAADFDRDGKIDLYLCCYVYFQTEAQYTYPIPYHDAQNGPPNFLFRNRLTEDGTGAFVDCTRETGMSENNNRFSFAPAWCDYNGDGWPDLYVANDFGKKNLYRNQGGRFRDVALEAGVENLGPGMSASWFDYDQDGLADLYVANMWTDAGQRISANPAFQPSRNQAQAYRGHTMGNSLYQNRGNGRFTDVTAGQHAGFGRWAWSAGGHDFDNDGRPELFVTCGMLTNQSSTDLNSFFWRQVVAKSPTAFQRSSSYENGWNALNQFVREDFTWNGDEPNVLHIWRNGRYYDFSGVSGLDVAEDGRAFSVTDIDGDGRSDLILKSRLGPQVRVFQNNCAEESHAIGIQLQGVRSNRDAIGARVEVDGQTKWVEAGSGFLSQHSKKLLFGLGSKTQVGELRILWPSGIAQRFQNLKAGATYFIQEEAAELSRRPFRERQTWRSQKADGDNRLALHDTWFVEPIPLPTAEKGPGLFVLREIRPEYQVFRRYLFDWRTELKVPFALLLDGHGDAVKIYGDMPKEEQVRADLQVLDTHGNRALPFAGLSVKKPRRDFYKLGAGFLLAGMPRQALPYLQRVLDRSPDNGRVLTLVGQIYLEIDDADRARTHFERAILSEPDSTNALIGLGDIAAKGGRPAAAEDYYRKALTIDAKSAGAANGLGLALAKKGDLQQAQDMFEKAISEQPSYADAINNLAVLFARQGKVNDAIAAWLYGIRVAPDEDILYLNLGRTYVQLGQRDRARAIMQNLLDRKPGNPTAQHALDQLNGQS